MATEKDFLVKSSVVAPTSLQVGSAIITSSGTSIALPANSTIDDGAGGSINLGIPSIPDLTGYATESYVTTALTSYATTLQLSTKANSADLSTVALTGNYNDLSNTPSLSSYATTASLSSYATLTGANFTGNVDVTGTISLGGNWTIVETDGALYFKNSGVSKVKITSDGAITSVDDVTAVGTM